jgi:HEAT repeat protein
LIGWLALQIGGSAEDLCVAAIDLSKPAIAQAAFEASLTAGFARSEAKVLEAFSNPTLAPIGIRLAGALAMHKAVPNLMAVAGEATNPNRLRAITSLGQIGDAASKALLEASAESANPDERAAAVNGLSKIAGAAAEVGKRLMSSELERTVRVGIQLLATQTDAVSIAAIAAMLSDSRRGVVIQALTALDGRVPRTSWQLVTSLRQSPDPLIKAVARRIDLGR